MTIQTPPHNTEVEQQLLSAVLTEPRTFDHAGALRSEHFYEPAHGVLWGHIHRAVETGKPVSAQALAHVVRDDSMFADLGGAGYLGDLVAASLGVRNVNFHARIIIDLYERRQAIQIFEQAVDALHQDSDEVPTASSAIEAAETRIDKIRGEGPDRDAEAIHAPLKRAIDRADDVRHGKVDPGVKTGLIDVDAVLGGLQVGDLCLLAARPGMGKTSLATKIAVNVARDHGPVLFATMEMTSEQLAMRICCEQAKVEFIKTRTGEITDADYQALSSEEKRLSALPLEILDRPGLTLPALRAACRRFKRRHKGLSLVVIDYLGLITVPRGGKSRYEDVSDISRDAKKLGKMVGAPVLALHQLSRANEQREDKTPQLSDLRDSGSLEQDADQVAFIHREAEYVRRAEPRKREGESEYDYNERVSSWTLRLAEIACEAEVILAKNRHGKQDRVKVHFDPPYMAFGNLSQRAY